MKGVRQTIAVITTFIKPKVNSLERRADGYWSSNKRNTLCKAGKVST